MISATSMNFAKLPIFTWKFHFFSVTKVSYITLINWDGCPTKNALFFGARKSKKSLVGAVRELGAALFLQ